MATFGLDNSFITKLVSDLDVSNVQRDQATDFFLLPQLDAMYRHCGDKLKTSVAKKLRSGTYGPKPPIEMEVPKSARVSAKTASLVGPNYFRPGSILYPEDRIVYHFLAQESQAVIEEAINRQSVFSNKPLAKTGSGLVSQSKQWDELKKNFEKEVKSKKYTVALKCDIAQYFFSINQHELVNQLEHQGLASGLVKFAEKFLAGLTVDRSSRGILQGLYASDLLGNGYLTSIDEFIAEKKYTFFRYVDDIYILFEKSDDLRLFFPEFVKKLRDYDLSLNESKTFATAPAKLLREETELDKAIAKAKKEASEKLTDYEEIEIEVGPYGDTVTDILETPPDEGEVELEATLAVFQKLDDFQGEERHRAESFCLNFFRRAADPVALEYVTKKWLRNPDRAREYAHYLNRFLKDPKQRSAIDAMITHSAAEMTDYQWSWAALLMRRFSSMSSDLLALASNIQRDGSKHEVVRSLLTYAVCRHGSGPRKKAVRDSYGNSPLLVQLATIHSCERFTSGERSALMKTAEAHGELQALMCEAFKVEQKAST